MTWVPLSQLKLDRADSQFLKNNLSNHYYSNPSVIGIIYRRKKEPSDVLSRLVKLGGYAIFKIIKSNLVSEDRL